MISVVIPARNEPYLQRTIDDILEKSTDEIEIIAVLDGYWPKPSLKNHKQVVIVHNPEPKGMRWSINDGVKVASGKFILKCDGHCCFAPGFDKQLIKDIEGYNHVLVPVRYVLDTNTWDRIERKKYEFEYIASDDLKGRKWPEYAERVKGQKTPDLLTMQGSCWFMTKQFFEEIGGEDDVNYGRMGREAQEIALKTWLSGGRLSLTRNTWYGHWNKLKKNIFKSNKKEKYKSIAFAKDLWLNDKWDKAIYPMSWLINKFAPVPTWETQMTIPETIENNYETELVKDKNHIRIKGMTRAGLYKLFSDLDLKIGAEVGVQRARNAWVMFQNMPNLKHLTLVDPYEDHPSNKRHWGERLHDKFKKQAYERMKDYPVEWIYGFSEEVSGQIKDNTLDFVYIDGEHTYDFVMIDLVLWSRKVRPGGIISGHDYEYQKPKQPKVSKAINHFASVYDLFPIYMTDKKAYDQHGDKTTSWFWIKK